MQVDAVAAADSLWGIDLEQSISIYKEVIDEDSSNRYALNQLAHALRTSTRYRESIEVFTRLIHTPEYGSDVLFFIADAYFHQGDFASGLDFLHQSIDAGFTNLYHSGPYRMAILRNSAYFPELKKTSGFKQIMEKIALRPFDLIVQYSSWSPDGNQLVIQAALFGSGSYDLWLYNLSNSALERLTYTRESEMAPKWSPKGDWIVFHRANLYGGAKELYLITADGTKEKQLTNQKILLGNKSFPNWTVNGSKVIFVSELDSVNHDIYQIDIETGNTQRLTNSVGHKSNPSINEFQELIYDVQLTDDSYSIVKEDIKTGTRSVLNHHNWWWTPVWIADTKILAGYYDTGATMLNRLMVINSDGSDKKYITAYGEDAWFPAVSADGTKVAFAVPENAFFMGGSILGIIDLINGERETINLEIKN